MKLFRDRTFGALWLIASLHNLLQNGFQLARINRGMVCMATSGRKTPGLCRRRLDDTGVVRVNEGDVAAALRIAGKRPGWLRNNQDAALQQTEACSVEGSGTKPALSNNNRICQACLQTVPSDQSSC